MAKRREGLQRQIVKVMWPGYWMTHDQVLSALRDNYRHVPSARSVAHNLQRIDKVEVRTAIEKGSIVRYYRKK